MIELTQLTILYEWHGVPAGIKRVRDVVFKRIGDRELKLDILMPEKPAGPTPVVLWICGGGWRGMSRLGVEHVSGWLAGRGYAVIGFDYRLSHQAVFPAQIEDCKAAVRWVRANAVGYSLDPERIGVWGDSAGGHLAELLGVSAHVKELEREGPNAEQSSAVKAVCAFYPPADLVDMAGLDIVQELMGGPLQSRRRMYELASPITHVTPQSPPHLLVHGEADEIVPFEQSVRFDAALRRCGVECELVKLRGVKHSGHHLYGSEEVKDMVAGFFARHLKG